MLEKYLGKNGEALDSLLPLLEVDKNVLEKSYLYLRSEAYFHVAHCYYLKKDKENAKLQFENGCFEFISDYEKMA